jgi:hypothetical protein
MEYRALLGCLGLLSASLLAAGCGDDQPCQGAEGCACFPNGTCLEALSCASDFCVDLDGDGGPDGEGGVDDPGSTSSGGSGGAGTRGGGAGTRGGQSGEGGGAGSGGDGGTAGSGGTIEQGDACETSAECAALDDPCLSPVCLSGKCDSASRPAGSAVPDDTDGDCERLLCAADGELTSEPDGSDVPAEDGDPCTIATCDGTTAVQVEAPQGTETPESSQTAGDCLKVVCDGEGGIATVADDGDVSSEPSDDPCKERACDEGAPALGDVSAGTPCGSGQVCDGSGDCVTCTASGSSCTASAQCCEGLCQSGTTCAACSSNTRDCDANTVNGCETAINTSQNCGACGRTCPDPPNVSGVQCSNGDCVIGRCDGGYIDDDEDFANGCELQAEVGDQAYGPCTAADDSACGVGERCGVPTAGLILINLTLAECSASSTGCHCGFPCSAAADCPAPPSGTAVPACGSYCYLSCSASGSTCPTGMHCATIGSIFPAKACVTD